MTTIIYDSCYYLVDTLDHMKILKLKDHPGDCVAYFHDEILVNVESLESSGAFNTENHGYIIHIFKNTSNSRFQIWSTQKEKEVMEFVKKTLFCDEDGMHTNDTIIYGFLAQYSLQEYRELANSERGELTNIENISKDESLLLTSSTMAIESPVNKTVEKVCCKI